ncbi:hypothetical protein ACIQYL_06900 [Lysinibacillus xylanilyticus]|uniref:hypothetical protein n=1 Tax=Lysinibacillus xylanilyticus TaxID=582475 RepID=UPI0037FBBBD0
MRKKPIPPPKWDESTTRRISSERDLDAVKTKYLKLSKEELVNQLIAVEQYLAENQKRWKVNQFEQFQ